MRRLFEPQLREFDGAGGELQLSEEARRHAQVLRLEAGAQLRLFDGTGREADARVLRCDRRELVCAVEAPEHLPPPAARLTLVVCVPKAAKLELILRMTTELGLHGLQLALSERSVPKLSSESPKLERLRRIALEACAQSERSFTPELSGPQPLAACIAAAPSGAARYAFVERSHSVITAAAAGPAPQAPRLPASAIPSVVPAEVWAVVGPEGGFAPHELALLDETGYARVSLGSTILRVETACVVACALLLDRMRGAG